MSIYDQDPDTGLPRRYRAFSNAADEMWSLRALADAERERARAWWFDHVARHGCSIEDTCEVRMVITRALNAMADLAAE